MKNFFFITFLLALSCCSPFDENRILDNLNKFRDLVSMLEGYGPGSYDRDDIDEFEIASVRSLEIDYIIKNVDKRNTSYAGFVEENDSLVIFIKKSFLITSKEKRIIYDFSTEPRNFGNDEIKGASYRIVRLDERFYYSEIGFD